MHDKARAEMLIGDARQAVKEQAPLDRVRSLTADLEQILHGLPATTAGSGSGGAGQPSSPRAGDDDVIDAEFSHG